SAPLGSTSFNAPILYGGTAPILGMSTNGELSIMADGNNIHLRPNGSTTVGRVMIAANGNITIDGLTGTGTQMVTVNASGVLGRQAIPNMSGYLPLTGGTLTGNLRINTYLNIQRSTSGYVFDVSGTGYTTYNRIELVRTDGST